MSHKKKPKQRLKKEMASHIKQEVKADKKLIKEDSRMLKKMGKGC